jgi:hypothetical protein
MAPGTTGYAEADPPKRIGRTVARIVDLAARHPTAIGGSVLLAVGVGLVALVAKGLDLRSGSVLVIAFLGPLVAYLVLTRQLSEIGLGSFTVKLKEETRKPAPVQPLRAEKAQMVEKLEPDKLAEIGPLDADAPVVLSLTLRPRDGTYKSFALQQYIDWLARYPRFRFVVLLDHAERVVAYLPADVLSARNFAPPPPISQLLVDAVNVGNLPTDIGVRTEFLSQDATNEEALARMTALKLDAMLVRGDDRALVGVVERQDVLARLFLAAARS